MFVIEASERPIPHPQVRTLLWKSTASALTVSAQFSDNRIGKNTNLDSKNTNSTIRRCQLI